MVVRASCTCAGSLVVGDVVLEINLFGVFQ